MGMSFFGAKFEDRIARGLPSPRKEGHPRSGVSREVIGRQRPSIAEECDVLFTTVTRLPCGHGDGRTPQGAGLLSRAGWPQDGHHRRTLA